MCEAKIITFEDGANFLAATGVTARETALFNVVRGLVIGVEAVQSVGGNYFAQVTDNPEMQPTLLNIMKAQDIPVVEQTPEELLEEGFSEQAIVLGLRAARPLSAVA